MDDETLNQMLRKELIQKCKEEGIGIGTSNMNKDQLKARLRSHYRKTHGGGESKSSHKKTKKSVKKRKPPARRSRATWGQIKGKSASEMRELLNKWPMKELAKDKKSPCRLLPKGVKINGKTCPKLKKEDKEDLIEVLIENFASSRPVQGGGESKSRPEPEVEVEVDELEFEHSGLGEMDRVKVRQAIRKCLYGDLLPKLSSPKKKGATKQSSFHFQPMIVE